VEEGLEDGKESVDLKNNGFLLTSSSIEGSVGDFLFEQILSVFLFLMFFVVLFCLPKCASRYKSLLSLI